MIELKKYPKVEINWNVNPYDYSQEKQRSIIRKFSEKYSIPMDCVKVVPNFMIEDEEGNEISLTKDIVKDINDKEFQLNLFKEYLKISNIEDYDFDMIKDIDSMVNDLITSDYISTNKRFSIKWIKWDNFLSYGEGNYFDFSALNGIVLLHGESPYQNQSGKTTFAIDLPHFLFFGKTSKTENLNQIFNNKLQDSTEVKVEGCITIDGQDYLIRRTVTRPTLKRRSEKSKASQKVEYYKVIKDSLEELSDYNGLEETNGDSVQSTNKIIKEAIGSEKDFDLMMCATSDNLDDLISMKDTDRGKLFSRWIGLSTIEEKSTQAKAKFNSEIKPRLISNVYDRESLSSEIEWLKKSIIDNELVIDKNDKRISVLDNELNEFEETKKSLLVSKSKVDESLMKIDIKTVESRINEIISKGKIKREEIKKVEEELTEIGEVDFNIQEYQEMVSKKTDIVSKMTECRLKFSNNKKLIDNLKNSEFCPTCGRKYDNVDNSSKINEINEENEIIKNDGIKLNEKLTSVEKELEKLKVKQAKSSERDKLKVMLSTLQLKLEQMISEYKDKVLLKKYYTNNIEAINRNNELDISIRNTDINIRKRREERDRLSNDNSMLKASNDNSKNEIEKKLKFIAVIENEEKLVRNWKIYLDMIGKNGISKMVLKRALPIINANLSSMLNGVCDFTVSIEMTDKQDIIFYLVRDGIKSNLNSGSGFEMTCASLALRSVLTKINMLSKSDGLILDEILGRVASSNYENMRLLYEKILSDYRYIIQVTHIDDVKDWHNKILVISKNNGISSIKVEK